MIGRIVLQLCRFIKDTSMWACLGAMAVKATELSTAMEAYACQRLIAVQWFRSRRFGLLRWETGAIGRLLLPDREIIC